ncbi:TonB family protein [Rheinheimera oceanensis]|uniref:TonB family protein n=1 Tax=Rheinheimera oceanensis TaxID=2817449 RepID=UPI001BFD9B7F|nr:TonB family protein [Rheinheimera oceanensis]
MRYMLSLLFMLGTTVQADMLSALKAYEEKNYIEAQLQFAELLPLANEQAIFNLGVMAYQGEGQEKDLTKALAYFMLAAELKYEQASTLLVTLSAKASEQQLEQVTQQFEQLKRNLVITATDLDKRRDASLPQPIKRVPPEYPISAAKNGLFGYVKMRFLVNEAGLVTAIDTLDTFPENTFEKSAVKAVKKWRYEPSGQQHLMEVRLDYSLGRGVKVSAVEKIALGNKLWDYAVLGAPQHQLALGTLLSLVEIQSGNSFWYDPELPLVAQADFSSFESLATLKPAFDGFWGSALVRVAKDGTITEQIDATFEAKSELTSLVGLTLKGKVETDVYRIVRNSDVVGSRSINVTPYLRLSRSMSGMFWWEQAAKNGNIDAQRIMAAYDKQWEDYLLSKDDAEVMAWTGTRLILEGQRAQGMQLLEQAVAKNYEPATELKKQLM